MALVDDLARQPALQGLSRPRLEAIRQAGHLLHLGVGEVLLSPVPGTVRLATAGAPIQLAVCPYAWSGLAPAAPALGQAYADALQLSPPVRAGVIPEPVDGFTPHIGLMTTGMTTVLQLEPTDLRAVASAAAWRDAPSRWERVVRTLRIASVLACGAPFRGLGEVERTLLAARMRWITVAPGAELTRIGAVADALLVPGPGVVLSADVERAGALEPRLPMGQGCAVGWPALAVAGEPRRHRIATTAQTAGRVAVLDRCRFLPLARQSDRLRKLAVDQNFIAGRDQALVDGLAAHGLLGP